jgi:hypothetical protein
MQNETPMLSDFSSKRDSGGPLNDGQQSDENRAVEWMSSRQVQEPILWPRVFPGL